jgi:hypothetical protein
MVDSDNVLLLRPARAESGFALDGVRRPPPGAAESSSAGVTATICALTAAADETFVRAFERDAMQRLKPAGAPVLAYFVTEPAANNFPALPVREGENVFIWFSREINQEETHVCLPR